MLFSPQEIVDTLSQLGITHVVWVPDSDFGRWEEALDASPITLLRVCREGEAWPLAAGLALGGKSPLVLMQTTGLFESGDALRNVLFDLELPLPAVVGARNWLVDTSPDSARRFARPILDAWGLDYLLVAEPDDKPQLAAHLQTCRQAGRAGVVLLAEGAG